MKIMFTDNYISVTYNFRNSLGNTILLFSTV